MSAPRRIATLSATARAGFWKLMGVQVHEPMRPNSDQPANRSVAPHWLLAGGLAIGVAAAFYGAAWPTAGSQTAGNGASPEALSTPLDPHAGVLGAPPLPNGRDPHAGVEGARPLGVGTNPHAGVVGAPPLGAAGDEHPTKPYGPTGTTEDSVVVGSVSKAEGALGRTVSEVYAQHAELNGKRVRVWALVV
jgi:hypothetical protein